MVNVIGVALSLMLKPTFGQRGLKLPHLPNLRPAKIITEIGLGLEVHPHRGDPRPPAPARPTHITHALAE
jgi:hypothetical protein